jgi:hypothetical protein
MKTLNIDIDQADILSEVSKICSFVGGKEYQDGVSLYDAIRITDQEAPLLSEFILSAKMALLTRFNRMSEQVQNGISLLLPDETPDHDDAIVQLALNFIVNYVTAKWFKIVLSSREEEYNKYTTTALVNLEKEVFSLRKPTKRVNWTENNI